MAGYKETAHPPVWVRPAAAFIRRLPMGRYRAMDLVCPKISPAFWMQLSNEMGGLSFYCDLGDNIAREVCFMGHYEPQDTALVRSLLRPAMTFVDVGANWGYYTLLAAHLVGARGRVISFEPDPRLFPILQENVRRNELTNATALQVAAANEAGTLTLAGFDEHSERRGLSKLVEVEDEDGNFFRVQAKTVDSVLDKFGVDAVDFLKMDIEGAEELALQGMHDGLARHRYKRILLEVHPSILAERGRTVRHVTDLLVQAGYRAWWIDHSPSANRKAAYSRSLQLRDYLRPMDSLTIIDDSWPHMLWLSPDLELPT